MEEDNKKEEIINEEIREKSENIGKKQNVQIKWAVILMLTAILIILAVPYIKQNYFDRFKYNGLVFQKTKLGELTFYSANFPVVDIQGRSIGSYAMNFRNDPRNLEYIDINLSKENIEFSSYGNKYGPVYISLNPLMEKCNETIIAMATLSGFLKDSDLDVYAAVTDKAYAKDNNQTQKWCTPFETVIVITDGNETSIEEITSGCYKLTFKNCEVLPVTEKFMLDILKSYTARFE